MASLDDLLRQTQASYEFYLDNPEDEFNYDYTEPMMQPMEQTMMQPLTQDISIPNYIMPDMYEDDDEGASYNLPLDVARKGTALSNATKKAGINLVTNAFLNTVLPGSGTVRGLASLANYFNPPTPQSVFQFDNDVADARSETYSTNPGIGFSNIDPEDYDPSIGMDDDRDGGYDSGGADYSDDEMD